MSQLIVTQNYSNGQTQNVLCFPNKSPAVIWSYFKLNSDLYKPINLFNSIFRLVNSRLQWLYHNLWLQSGIFKLKISMASLCIRKNWAKFDIIQNKCIEILYFQHMTLFWPFFVSKKLSLLMHIKSVSWCFLLSV